MMRTQSEITVLVPVHNGGRFISDTLHCIQNQTFKNLKVRISIDASDDESSEICHHLEQGDTRFKVTETDRRLGWVRNINHLVSSVRTPFFCIIPQDDMIDKVYLERLFAEMTNPETAIAFSDLQEFGAAGRYFYECTLEGDPFIRIVRFLLYHRLALPFRGLIRTLAVTAPIARNRFPGPITDYLWLLEILKNGSFVRVPEVLYRKRRHAANQIYGWSQSNVWSFVKGMFLYWKTLNEIIPAQDHSVDTRSILSAAKACNYLTMAEMIIDQRGNRMGTKMLRTWSQYRFRSMLKELSFDGGGITGEVSNQLVYRWVRLLMADGLTAKAWQLLDRVSGGMDANMVNKLKAKILVRKGMFPEALEVLHGMSKSDMDGDTQLLLAAVYRKIDRHDEATDILRSLSDNRLLREKVLAELSRLYLAKGQVASARDSIEQAYQVNPWNRNILNWRSMINDS